MLKLVREREELRVVEIVSPTSTAELAKQILLRSQTDHHGLYHATAEGSCSWYEFAKKIFEIANANQIWQSPCRMNFPPKFLVRNITFWRISDSKPWVLTLSSNGEDGLDSYLVSTLPLN